MFGMGLQPEARGAVSAGLFGVGFGGLQITLTRAGDALGWFGGQWTPSFTNGQILNFVSGAILAVVGAIGLFGRNRLSQKPTACGFLFGWGMSNLVFGFAVPAAATAIAGKAARSGAAYGPSYPPPSTPSGVPFGAAPVPTQRSIAIASALTA